MNKDCRNILQQMMKKSSSTPQWMLDAVATYGIPLKNLKDAFEEWNNVEYAFHANSDSQWGYLKGDGKAYINTGVACGSTDDYFLEVKVVYDQTQFLMGSRTSGSKNTYAILFVWGTKYRFDLATTNDSGTQISAILKKLQTIEVKVGKAILDGTTVFENASLTNTASSYPMYIFSCNTAGTASIPSNAKFRKVYTKTSEGVTNKLYVPFCRSGVYGMIDLVSNTFYANAASSGSFTYLLE